jgi:hypothetical protein
MKDGSASDPSVNPWYIGAVDVPREPDEKPPAPPRGALRAAVSTAGYLAGLVARR